MLIRKVEQRIQQYINFLERAAYQTAAPLSFEVFRTSETLRAPPKNAAWQKITAPYEYGAAWELFWFRAEFLAAKTRRPLFLQITPNSDSLAFIDGAPCGAFNPFHRRLRIDADDARHTLELEVYGGHPFPGCYPFDGSRVMFTLSKTLMKYPNIFEGGELVEQLESVYGLYYDARVLLELAQTLNEDSLRKARILKGLYDALIEISFAAKGDKLDNAARDARKKIAPLLALKNSVSTPEIALIGHAHIDHAWLWHIGETERKIARTYINMTRLMHEYPEFIFIQSQSCQLEIAAREYPAVFNAVKTAFKSGNWESNGGMWVEADCNITSGESLIRQFLVGKAATKTLLGAGSEADTLWLPDVFGYAAALPQILAGCRIKYFVTSKISWNDTTRFPYDTFIWRGIDGTGIKTHYLASRTQGYNGQVSAASVAETWHEIQHKELQASALKSVGEGDGGGGTTRADLEMARRLTDLEGAPRASWKKISTTLNELFSAHNEWPEWRGELYLELHRGTYTTQARTKRFNRKIEFALRDVEWCAALRALDGGAAYPYDELLRAWKTVLTNQFHDIIPGSSIHRVYEEAEAQYQKTSDELAALSQAMRTARRGELGVDVLVLNSLSWQHSAPQSCPAALLDGVDALRAHNGGTYPVQRWRDVDGGEMASFAAPLPAMGAAGFAAASIDAQRSSPFTYTAKTLDTPFYHIEFDEYGRITHLIDTKTQREFIAEGGRFNRFISAEDVPVLWEAWDIDSDWTKSAADETRLAQTEVAADGALCFRLRRVWDIGGASRITQDMVCYAEERRIDFDTRVDWNERQRLLKAGFDTAIDAMQVRCEVQYGHILRNTHRNLPHDRAKFEVCAHKWISLEDAGGGIALLNDCKYGHDVTGGSMRITLLRAPEAPDETADAGNHRFVYSILPFSGHFDERVIRAGYELNVPALTAAASKNERTGASCKESSFCTVGAAGIIIESVKAPEDRTLSSCVILRLYESLGGQTRTELRFSRTLKSAWQTDMLEENPQALASHDTGILLEFRPFEIKTIRVEFKK